MIPELGQFALILALCLSILLCSTPFANAHKPYASWMQLARPLALGQCFFTVLSFGCLLYSFYANDFSVQVVAAHSNSTLPDAYRIAALWGGHEGSLLLWVLILSMWIMFVSLYSRSLPLVFTAFLLSVLGIIFVGFLLFLLLTSNPFARLLPYMPVDGRDLNPLLQDPGLMIHPPILYVGYAGLAVPFAFAVSALALGKLETVWIRWLRPWVLVAFSFLTVGIVLGSGWAYYELGWGGWWFWDPVENASFMPWLIVIALIHSLFVSEKHKLWIGWTLFLALTAFALTLLGLCLVRSGVLTSVHAFASDPARGVFMLSFLAMVVGGACLLYVCKIQNLTRTFHGNYLTEHAFFSREILILCSTVFLIVGMLTLLLGTLFPLLYEFLTAQKISVGFPYFNAVFIPLMVPFLFLIPLGPMSRWGIGEPRVLWHSGRWTLLASIVFSSLLVLWLPPVGARESIQPILAVILGLTLGFWIILTTLNTLNTKMRIQKISLGYAGMILAHTGIAISIIGIVIVSHYQIEKEVRIKPGDSMQIADYTVTFVKTDILEGQNYMSYRGVFHLTQQGKQNENIELSPEKRVFLVQKSVMTETAIDPGWFRDIYIALGDKLEGGAWTARIYYKPFVRWIWMGGLMMAMGAICAAISKLRHKKIKTKNT